MTDALADGRCPTCGALTWGSLLCAWCAQIRDDSAYARWLCAGLHRQRWETPPRHVPEPPVTGEGP